MKPLTDKMGPFERRRDWEMIVAGRHGDHRNGVYSSVNARGELIRIIAASGMGWDHVSISYVDRIPMWPEMELVKRAFFKDDEAAFQLHPATAEHINHHPNTLHLWRPLPPRSFPMPPAIMVGPKANTKLILQ